MHGLAKKAQLLIAEAARDRLLSTLAKLQRITAAAAAAPRAAALAAEAAHEMWAHASEYWEWVGVVSDGGGLFAAAEEPAAALRLFAEGLLDLARAPAAAPAARKLAAERAHAFFMHCLRASPAGEGGEEAARLRQSAEAALAAVSAVEQES